MTNWRNGKALTSDAVHSDDNCFIYAVIDGGKIGSGAKKILRQIESGFCKGFTDTLAIDGFLWRVQKELSREEAIQGTTIFFTLSNLEVVSADNEIIQNAVSVYRDGKLDSRDVIYLACRGYNKLNTSISFGLDFDRVKGIKRVGFSK